MLHRHEFRQLKVWGGVLAVVWSLNRHLSSDANKDIRRVDEKFQRMIRGSEIECAEVDERESLRPADERQPETIECEVEAFGKFSEARWVRNI